MGQNVDAVGRELRDQTKGGKTKNSGGCKSKVPFYSHYPEGDLGKMICLLGTFRLAELFSCSCVETALFQFCYMSKSFSEADGKRARKSKRFAMRIFVFY